MITAPDIRLYLNLAGECEVRRAEINHKARPLWLFTELFLGLLLRGAIARPRCPAKRTQISRRKSGNEEKQAPFSFFSFCLLFSCALLRPIMMIFASELLFAITALHTFAYLLASCGFSSEMGNVEKRDRQLESRADAEERNGWKSELTQIPIHFHESRLISDFAISLRFIFRFSSKLLSTQSLARRRARTRKQTADAVSYVLKFVIQRLKILTRLKKLFSSFLLFLVLFFGRLRR